MIRDIRTHGSKRKERLLRLAMRKLKRWGEEPADADSDIAPLLECYQYTYGTKGMELRCLSMGHGL